MKSLLFTLGLALCCFLQANGYEPFETSDHKDIEGPCFVVAVATTCRKIENMLPNAAVMPTEIKKLTKDTFQMTTEIKTPNGCMTMKKEFKQREDQKFHATCKKGGETTLGYINKAGESVSVSVEITHKKGSCKMATLAVKDLADTEEALQNFNKFAETVIPGAKVYALSTEDMCPRST